MLRQSHLETFLNECCKQAAFEASGCADTAQFSLAQAWQGAAWIGSTSARQDGWASDGQAVHAYRWADGWPASWAGGWAAGL